MSVRRIYVEKRPGFDVEAQKLLKDLRNNLGISNIENIRILNRYDVEGIEEEVFEMAKRSIFSEPPVDVIYEEDLPINKEDKIIAVEFLPGQYDQRADSAAQCIQLISMKEAPRVRVAKISVISGNISSDELAKIKNYIINPVESQEASLDKFDTLVSDYPVPSDIEILYGFINKSEEELKTFMEDMGFAMSFEDLLFCRDYFKNVEKRDPSITEMRVIDTYWSDHCRHTTFLTRIEDVEFEEGTFTADIRNIYNKYLKTRKQVYKEEEKDICLMDIATIAMKKLKSEGFLDDLDESDEINACSINVKINVDGKSQEWLVMFKNETHNHPTEIEPFGGAATCLGGAIRDPLSGRSYVYQAMRVTGSADPRCPISETMPGKLPQRVITTTAAHGYSSYGNQIGLATGQVSEIYHPDYVAKRMEIGAVIGAAPKQNVVRRAPVEGDLVILLGGRTGRDGCGGATGSSKEHTEESLATCGAEVQKGNPPTERKIQRLFRKPEVSRLIKKCNDFGAGGVSVAIGELADGLDIDLDAVPKKYKGLDGTELAISESQERMAVIVSPEDVSNFIEEALKENLEATVVAKVTNTNRLRMKWRDKWIVDIRREFLNTNGVKQTAKVYISEPEGRNFFERLPSEIECYREDLKKAWLSNLKRLNVCSQKGLVEMFDSTIGASTVQMPFGGINQLTPTEGMVARIPLEKGKTTDGTFMSYGFNPYLSKWSPYHGAVYAVVESVAKIVSMGGNHRAVRLTLQEYFEKLGRDPKRWGKPLSALLGAFHAQVMLKIPAIGGKDSMSGTFKDISVPPTLVSFAVAVGDTSRAVSPEFKKPGNKVVLLKLKKDENFIPDFSYLDDAYKRVHRLIQEGKILACSTIKFGGLSEVISKMCFGNSLGFSFNLVPDFDSLFKLDYGSLVMEINEYENVDILFKGLDYVTLGRVLDKPEIKIGNIAILLSDLLDVWKEPLEGVFPSVANTIKEEIKGFSYVAGVAAPKAKLRLAKPRVFIPVFPGTNCEYDTKRAFEDAGAQVNVLVFRNLNAEMIEESVWHMVKNINNSQIIMIPGGFSAGDEPEGSGKFIATVFRNPYISEAVMDFLKKKDGLMLGICNGFQALIKLGLLPYGEIRDLEENSPTLTFNTIGRHISCLVRTKVVSNLSPWLSHCRVGDVHTIAISHGEGRFIANKDIISSLAKNGQIATQYVDIQGNPTYNPVYNPNGSLYAIEGITSRDGRIFGKMGHTERYREGLFKNVPGEKNQPLFRGGVEYFL